MDKIKTEIYCRHYNLTSKDNLNLLPSEPAVYGIFGIIDGQPVNCRHVDYAADLQAAIRIHFDADPDPGLKTFMQGPWLKMLLYILKDRASDEEFGARAEDWKRQYKPLCNHDGEYESERVSA